MPAFKLIESDSNDVFISLNKLLVCDHKNEINDAFKNELIIEEFLRQFNPKNLKNHKKKLRIEDSSEDEEEPVKKIKKQPKKKLIVESTSSVSPPKNNSSSDIVIKKKKKTKKTKLVGIKPKTKKNKNI